jgi:predicted DCC family thiol-disulfide oxidoreductase YuxK
MSKPILIFDGDCGFCRRWIERWRGITGDRIDYAPYQEAAPRFPEISEEEFRESVQLVLPNGKFFRGAEAVFRSLWEARSHRWLLWGYRNIPGVRTLSEAAYSLVARNRPFFSRMSRFFLGDESQRSEYRASIFLFPRLLGAAYFIAFASLAVQAPALFGPKGILPNVPEPLLDCVTWGGALSAVLVTAGIAQSAFLALCWLLYLFLLGTGGPFMAFQWDTLLLEAGFIGIFLSLGRGSCFMRTFLKLLLFKLMLR